MHDPPTATGARPFLSIPDVVRERIYAYVLTVDVADSAPWITPLPALSHARNKALATLPTLDKSVPIGELTAKRKRDRVKKEAALRTRENEVLKNLRPSPASSCLAILATCRTILLEAFHLWYQYNTLNFSRSEDLYNFLLCIGSVRANEIRSLRLDMPHQDWSHAKAKFALGRLLKLERLVIIRPFSVYGPHIVDRFLLPDIVKDLRGLKEVEVLTCGGHSGRALEAIEEAKERMLRPRAKLRKPPKMVDLFGKLNNGKQTAIKEPKEGDEGSGYAPDVASILLAKTVSQDGHSYWDEP